MTSPNVGILEEIDEQHIADTTAGADPATVTVIACYTVASILLGNDGWVCTLTVECQDGC